MLYASSDGNAALNAADFWIISGDTPYLDGSDEDPAVVTSWILPSALLVGGDIGSGFDKLTHSGSLSLAPGEVVSLAISYALFPNPWRRVPMQNRFQRKKPLLSYLLI